MAKMNFGGVIEEVMTREEFPLEKAREVLKDETIAETEARSSGHPSRRCLRRLGRP